ncbi:MAG: HAMP domain-containing histidine kinase [Gemmatimonadetes bacterium]|nr:HAMP domain-containing histidine kinase [Gemmatimonadota bacterium]
MTNLALAALFALGVGWWLARRPGHAALRDLESFLQSWDDDDEPAGTHAVRPLPLTRRAGAWRSVFDKLDTHRQAFRDLRSVSLATRLRLRKIIDVVTEEVLVYEPEGRLLFASGKLRKLGGSQEGDAAGALEDTGQEDVAAESELLECIAAVIARSQDLGSRVPQWLTGDGSGEGVEVTLEIEGEPHRFFATPHLLRARRGAGPTGGTGLLVVMTDMAVIEELRRSAGRAVALEHVHLAAELLAHRARNPLNSIVLLLELVRRKGIGAADESAARSLETIGSEVERLEVTLEQFLEMIAERDRPPASVDLAAVVENVAELLYPPTRDCGVAVARDLRVATARVRGHEVEITRCVLAPSLAALRRSARGGELRYRLDSQGAEHLLLLESAGIPDGSVELTVAEELAVRNGGRLVYDDPRRNSRLTFRFRSEHPSD